MKDQGKENAPRGAGHSFVWDLGEGERLEIRAEGARICYGEIMIAKTERSLFQAIKCALNYLRRGARGCV